MNLLCSRVHFHWVFDDNKDALLGFDLDHEVGKITEFEFKEDDLFICGIGSVKCKKKLCQPCLMQVLDS